MFIIGLMEMAQKLNKLDLEVQVQGAYSILSIIVPKNEKVKPNQNQNNKNKTLRLLHYRGRETKMASKVNQIRNNNFHSLFSF